VLGSPADQTSGLRGGYPRVVGDVGFADSAQCLTESKMAPSDSGLGKMPAAEHPGCGRLDAFGLGRVNGNNTRLVGD
jgi:hypothetical protein